MQTKQLQTPNQSTYQMKAVNNPAAAQRSAAIQRVINTGMKYRGTPYEFGSNRSTTRTFDCSDFVKHAYAEGAGIKLPADSRQQGMYVRNKGTANTNWRALRAGDVMFFSSPGVKITGTNRYRVRITHDGIYLGDGRILHTYSRESGGVRIDSIAGSQWERRFLFGGSVIR
ncbi:C40 family peptidase [Paenibacillus methanolicus]|uniref:C40 family peptidase n=1 Tax=Paenibacillus methanolicus TaxID=582686 RepID=UPI001FEB837F|nr:C40 family peptidase [Paenibacillus methanolicus]